MPNHQFIFISTLSMIFAATASWGLAPKQQCDSAVFSSDPDLFGDSALDPEYISVNVTHTNSADGGTTHTYSRGYVLQKSNVTGLVKADYKRLVIILHGGRGSGCAMQENVALQNIALNERKIGSLPTLYVFPNGLQNVPDIDNDPNDPFVDGDSEDRITGDNRYFNDYREGSSGNRIDEGELVERIYYTLKNTHNYSNLDSDIFVAGHSNGASALHIIAYNANVEKSSTPVRVAATFGSSGQMPVPVDDDDKYTDVHTLLVHGQGDGFQDIDGTNNVLLSTEATFDKLKAEHGSTGNPACKTYLFSNSPPSDFFEENDIYGNRVDQKRFTPTTSGIDCSTGQAASYSADTFLEYYRVYHTTNTSTQAGHCWHGETVALATGEYCTQKFPATEVMIDFFNRVDAIIN